MDRYRSALTHLNSAIDAMIEAGETGIVANIAHPIALVERALLNERQKTINAAMMQGEEAR